MSKIITFSVLLGVSILASGCSVFEGRPEEDNIDQARGSYVWMTERLNEEQDSNQVSGQFGNQSDSNLNDERAINDY